MHAEPFMEYAVRVPQPPEPLSPLSATDQIAWALGAKKAIRTKLSALRLALPERSAAARSERIVQRLLAHARLVQANGVALFWPMQQRREIDLRPLDLQLRQRGVRLYYPAMTAGAGGSIETSFRLVNSLDELVPRGKRFAEPPPEAPLAARGEIDVVVVPALAATPSGHRLGYGAGFYDATLPDICPPAFSIVVVNDFQLMLELPLEAHDYRCDEVVTDAIPRV